MGNTEGEKDESSFAFHKYKWVLPKTVEPHRYPEVNLLRQTLMAWRFYHQFRTDALSPLRYPQIGVHTNVMSHDGSDLAAALEAIIEMGDAAAFSESVARAFAGASPHIT